MGRVKSHIHEWRENFGDELGYEWDNVPSMGDLDGVARDMIPAWEYYGYQSEKDYYSNQSL